MFYVQPGHRGPNDSHFDLREYDLQHGYRKINQHCEALNLETSENLPGNHWVLTTRGLRAYRDAEKMMTSKRWRVQFSEEPQFVCSFLLPQGGRCRANYLELHIFFVFSLCSPKLANKNTSKCNMEVIPCQSKYHLRPKTSTHKVRFFRRNLWCFGRYQEIGETYACFQVARFPGFGVLTYRTYTWILPWNHGWPCGSPTNGLKILKVWFLMAWRPHSES